MKYILHVSVYALCHVGDTTLFEIFVCYCLTAYRSQLGRHFMMFKCGMLPFFTSENPFKLFPQSVDGMKCEEFWLENVKNTRE